MRYEEADDRSREEILKLLESGEPEKIISALHSATYYESDWRWVQSQCLRFLSHPTVNVRWAAAVFLGDIAVFHKTLDLEIVLPVLYEASKDPAIQQAVQESLDFIDWYITKH